VADGVDAAVQPVQAAGVETLLDLVARRADRQQLAPGDDSVLAGRDRRDGPIESPRLKLCRSGREKFNHGPSVAAAGARKSRRP
jgi:hypothetical protein